MGSFLGSMPDPRNPKYTGENRCLPCTFANLIVGGVLGGVIAASVTPLAGAIAFAGCLGVVYLRGYLVPGTPTLTRRYLPAGALRLFGKEPIERTIGEIGTTDTWTALDEAGIVTGRESGDRLRLDDGFRATLTQELESRGRAPPTPVELCAILDAEEVARLDALTVSVDGTLEYSWNSEPELVTDGATAAVLRKRVADWDDLDRDTRLATLRRIRLLLDRCPTCDGPVERTRERLDACCHRPHVAVRAECPDCGVALAEVVVLEADAGEWVAAIGADGDTESTSNSSIR